MKVRSFLDAFFKTKKHELKLVLFLFYFDYAFACARFTKTTERVNATTNEITIPMLYIARLSGLIDGIPKEPAAPNAMAFTLKNAIKALAKPEPIIAAKKA